MASLQDRVSGLIEYIQTGKILDAMTEFYHDDATMQENRNEPRVGLEANIEHEKKFLSQVKDFHGFGAAAVGVDESSPGTGDVLVESWLEFTNTEGTKVRLEQVSVTRWVDGKIKSERFYYDSAG